VIGLDTNVLVRYLVQDDPDQAARATRFIEGQCHGESPGLVNRIVLCELVWVLESCYAYSRTQIADVVERMLRTSQLVVETPDDTWAALTSYRTGRADFADALICVGNRRAGCSVTVTLDRAAAVLAGFELLS
jgi:predicted nucleic-acid-binding protein